MNDIDDAMKRYRDFQRIISGPLASLPNVNGAMASVMETLHQSKRLAEITRSMSGSIAHTKSFSESMKPAFAMLDAQKRLKEMVVASSLKPFELSTTLNEALKPFGEAFQHQSQLAEITRTINQALVRTSGFSEMMKPAFAMLDEQRRLNEMVAASSLRAVGHTMAINDAVNPALDALHNHHLAELTRTIGNSLGPISRFEEITKPAQQLLQATESAKQVQNALARSLHALPRIDRDMKWAISEAYLTKSLGNLSTDEFAQLEGDTPIDRESADWKEAIEVVTSLVQEVSEREGELGHKLDELLAMAASQRSPLYKQILLNIVMNVIWEVLIFISISLATCASHQPQVQQIVRDVREFVSANGQSSVIALEKSYCVVASRILQAREYRDRTSEVVHILEAGDIVHVIERRKKWRLIEWYEPKEFTPSRGWVLSKYITKL